MIAELNVMLAAGKHYKHEAQVSIQCYGSGLWPGNRSSDGRNVDLIDCVADRALCLM